MPRTKYLINVHDDFVSYDLCERFHTGSCPEIEKKLKQTFVKQNRMKPRFNGVVKGLRPRKTDLFLKRHAVCPIRMANLSAGEIAGEFSDSYFAHNLDIDEREIALFK